MTTSDKPAEQRIVKVVVLNDPYFPLQKLQIRFSGMILQHMEMDDSIPQPFVGMQFGIVQKLNNNFRSNVRHGVLCEVVEFEYESSIHPEAKQKGFVMVKAVGRLRFHISRILHRALDGLIMTCEVQVFTETNSSADLELTKSEKFTNLKNQVLEYCKLGQTYVSPQKQIVF
jgi:hypothetical protein